MGEGRREEKGGLRGERGSLPRQQAVEVERGGERYMSPPTHSPISRNVRGRGVYCRYTLYKALG